MDTNTLVKPTFGQNNTDTTKVTPSDDLTQRRKSRPEVGAIWKRTSKSDMEYMTIQLNKKLIEDLLASGKTRIDTYGNVLVDLVAFPNKKHSENSRQPAFRVYEEVGD